MERKKRIVPFTSVELIQVFLKNIKKQKRLKRKRKMLQASKETFK